ncbi:MAG: agmatine deiminase family protein [Legionella sp.]
MNNRATEGFYMPAEWHQHQCCWMAWPCHAPTWAGIGLQRAREAYARVARAIAQFEPVMMLINAEDEESARQLCDEFTTLIVMPLNDSWLRDTGPTFLINRMGQLAGVDWLFNAWGNNYPDHQLDQQIAKQVIALSGAHYLHAPLVMEGGAFHVDGEGTLLTSKECLLHSNRNPGLSQAKIEQNLCDYLAVTKIIWLNKGLIGDETDGHIDELATFIAPGKVLCLISSDEHDPNYALLAENRQILEAATDASGRKLEVYCVEQPPATFLAGERLTLSYINFYHANKGIVMPSFNHPHYDEQALNLFKQLFPDYRISQIDALDVFAGGGGIHCITQQQPSLSQKKPDSN